MTDDDMKELEEDFRMVKKLKKNKVKLNIVDSTFSPENMVLTLVMLNKLRCHAHF